jgi:hypothetical protein
MLALLLRMTMTMLILRLLLAPLLRMVSMIAAAHQYKNLDLWLQTARHKAADSTLKQSCQLELSTLSASCDHCWQADNCFGYCALSLSSCAATSGNG